MNANSTRPVNFAGTPSATPTTSAVRKPPTRVPGAKRKHPARKSRVGALVLSVSGTAIMAFTMIGSGPSTAAAASLAPSPTETAPAAGPALAPADVLATPVDAPLDTLAAPTLAPVAAAPALAVAAPAAAVATKSGKARSFTGPAVSNRWGQVQAAITVSKGKIVGARTPVLPSSKRKSARISAGAGPILISETVTAQSSSVANVSGATYTSDSYKESLQAAIDSARAAGALA